jgi:hypothetical protein
MSAHSLLTCPKCSRPLPPSLFNASGSGPCPACGTIVGVTVFPALHKPLSSGTVGEHVVMDDEASCFYHPQKKAVVPCDSCGRFLCALCDVELNEEHLCPNCLESGRQKGKLKHLDKERILYDNIALRVAVYPVILLFFWFLTFITAPAAIVLSIRYWNKPTSMLPRTKIRFILAIVIAVAQLGLWAWLVIGVWLS